MIIDELQRLVNIILPPLIHLDTLWHLKWFFNSGDQVQRPDPAVMEITLSVGELLVSDSVPE